MLDEEQIQVEFAILSARRQTLALLLHQQELQGGVTYALPATMNGIVEARNAIHRIKAALREYGVPVVDEVNDEPPDQDVSPRVLRLRARIHNHRSFIHDHLNNFVGRERELEELHSLIVTFQPYGGYIILTGDIV